MFREWKERIFKTTKITGSWSKCKHASYCVEMKKKMEFFLVSKQIATLFKVLTCWNSEKEWLFLKIKLNKIKKILNYMQTCKLKTVNEEKNGIFKQANK